MTGVDFRGGQGHSPFMDPAPGLSLTLTDLPAGLYARSASAIARARRLIALQPALTERSLSATEASREILVRSASAAAKATEVRLDLAARRARADQTLTSTAGSPRN